MRRGGVGRSKIPLIVNIPSAKDSKTLEKVELLRFGDVYNMRLVCIEGWPKLSLVTFQA